MILTKEQLTKTIMSIDCSLLTIGMLIVLPIPYGVSRVTHLPRLNYDRQYVIVDIESDRGTYVLTCTKNKSFDVIVRSIQ